MKRLLQVVVPVLNELPHLPALLSGLASQKDCEIFLVVVDNGSRDGSWEFLRKWKAPKKSSIKKIKLIQEKRRGFAPPLNRGLEISSAAAYLAILDANTIPASGWAAALLDKFSEGWNLLVGNTKSKISSPPTASEKFAEKLFSDFSLRAATAQAHALPWGPNCNLAFSRSIWKKTGKYSEPSGPALDLDWCWRAVITGASLAFAPDAIATHARRADRLEFLQQMQRYGYAENWMLSHFAPLLGQEELATQDPILAALAAADRINSLLVPEELQTIQKEAALAFATGIALGAANKKHKTKLKPIKKAIGWPIDADHSCLFKPGMGIAELHGLENFVWQRFLRGYSPTKISSQLAAAEHSSPAEAAQFVKDFFAEVENG